MQLVSALLFSLPPPLGRNPQIKPRVKLQIRGVSCLDGGEKGVVGSRGGHEIGVRGRGSLDGGMATNVQLYLLQIAT